MNQPDERRTQAVLMLAGRLGGDSVKDLQVRFRCSRSKVMRYLAEARANGAVEDARTRVVGSLLPKALAVLEAELDRGNVDVATHVVYGTGTLLKNPQPPSTMTEETTDEIDTIEAYRAERARRFQQGLTNVSPETP
jgi:hypothetical protein